MLEVVVAGIVPARQAAVLGLVLALEIAMEASMLAARHRLFVCLAMFSPQIAMLLTVLPAEIVVKVAVPFPDTGVPIVMIVVRESR